MAGLERTYEGKHLDEIQKGYNRLARMLRINADTVAKDIARLQAKRLIAPEKYGKQLKRNKELQKLINQNFAALEKDLFTELNSQTSEQWILANQKNNILTQSFLGEVPVEFAKLNLDALDAFQKRTLNGLNLSERVHNLTTINEQLYQDYLGSGITQGKSSASIARGLNEINLNARNVTVFDAAGNPTKLGKISPLLQPNASGRGIYRDPLKNLFRVARTETNSAYRLSDHERMKQLDFVVGVEIHLSGAHNLSDVCDFMAGKYPKDFKFEGWHPACMCYVTSILKTKEEFVKGVKTSKNEVKQIPKSAQRYVKTRGAKLKNNNWYKDNFVTEKTLPKIKGTTSKVSAVNSKAIIASAEKKAIQQGVGVVDFGGFSVEHVTQINRALSLVPKKAIPNYIGNSTKYSSVIGRPIGRKVSEFYGVNVNSESLFPLDKVSADFISKNKGLKTLGGKFRAFDTQSHVFLSNGYKTPAAITQKKKAFNKSWKERTGTDYFFVTDGNLTVTHEFGHVFDNKFGRGSGWDSISKRWFEKSKVGHLKSPSEAWADAFADTVENGGENLPSYIRKYVTDRIELSNR